MSWDLNWLEKVHKKTTVCHQGPTVLLQCCYPLHQYTQILLYVLCIFWRVTSPALLHLLPGRSNEKKPRLELYRRVRCRKCIFPTVFIISSVLAAWRCGVVYPYFIYILSLNSYSVQDQWEEQEGGYVVYAELSWVENDVPSFLLRALFLSSLY